MTTTTSSTKLTHTIDTVNDYINAKKNFFSFEYYPPKTNQGVTQLKERLQRMKEFGPQWMDVTWGAGGSTSDLTPELCGYIQNTVNINCMMHLTCTNMPIEKLQLGLEKAKELNIRNILALRGDPPEGEKEWKAIENGFTCALDLVKYIKKNYGDYFGITVAGYPEGHPNVRKEITDPNWDPKTNKPFYRAPRLNDNGKWEGVCENDWKKELNYLKSKIDNGGQMIITQLFYDENVFLSFVEECRNIGINCPILPGIMPIRNYPLFKRMTGFCKTVIPKILSDNLVKLKDDQIEFIKYCENYINNMIYKILNNDKNNLLKIYGVHIYTMNTEFTTSQILLYLKLGNKNKIKETYDRLYNKKINQIKEKKNKKSKNKNKNKTQNQGNDWSEITSF